MPVLLTQRNLSFDLALDAAIAALETARSRGYHVGVAVTDRSGQLLVLLRDDGGGAHLLDGARRKAFTAVSAHNRTCVRAPRSPRGSLRAHVGYRGSCVCLLARFARSSI